MNTTRHEQEEQAPGKLFLGAYELKSYSGFPQRAAYFRLISCQMPRLNGLRRPSTPALYVAGLSKVFDDSPSIPPSEKYSLVPGYNTSDVAKLAVQETMQTLAKRIRMSNDLGSQVVTIYEVATMLGCDRGTVVDHARVHPELRAGEDIYRSGLSKEAVLNYYRLHYPNQPDAEVPGQEPLPEED